MSDINCPYCGGSGKLNEASDHIGARIHYYRTAKHMTQQDLGGKVGRSRAQIANIEAGRTDFPVSLLAIFATALGVKQSELVP